MLTPSRLRLGGVIVSCVAASVVVVAGCTTVVDGAPSANSEDAPEFRTSVSESIAASEATSSALESERLESLTTAAIHSTCETLSTTGSEAISAVNIYVDAFNTNAPAADVDAKAGTAVERLNSSADQVTAGITPEIPQPIVDAFNAWADAARALANAIATDAPTPDFNAAIDRLNAAKESALSLCDATY